MLHAKFTEVVDDFVSVHRLGVGCRMQDAGYRIQDTGYRIQDTGCRMLGTRCKIIKSYQI
jgi:hypothetical protein